MPYVPANLEMKNVGNPM